VDSSLEGGSDATDTFYWLGPFFATALAVFITAVYTIWKVHDEDSITTKWARRLDLQATSESKTAMYNCAQMRPHFLTFHYVASHIYQHIRFVQIHDLLVDVNPAANANDQSKVLMMDIKREEEEEDDDDAKPDAAMISASDEYPPPTLRTTVPTTEVLKGPGVTVNHMLTFCLRRMPLRQQDKERDDFGLETLIDFVG